MITILVSIISVCCLAALNTPIGTASNNVVIIAIFAISVALSFDLVKSRVFSEYAVPLLAGYYFRLFLLFFDIYGKSIYGLPNSGADSEMFYSGAVGVFKFGLEYNTGGLFSQTIGAFFLIIGPSRVMGQFIVVMFSFVALIFFVLILNNINIDVASKKKAVLICSLLPNFAILSSVFLRESIVAMFITISLFCFIIWVKNGNILLLIGAFTFPFIGALYHSGAVGMPLGYIIGIIFFDRKNNIIRISTKTIVTAGFFAVIFIYIYLNYGSLFFEKMLGVENNIGSIGESTGEGGSTYAQYVGDSSSLANMIKYTIPRIVYFLFSPFPWQWRGVSDIIAFFFSSLFYLITIINAFRNYSHIDKANRPLLVCLLIIASAAVFIFAWGVSNTGTAVRHRDKLILLFGTIFALSQKANKTSIF